VGAENIAAALRRVQAVLERSPETGLHDDAPATARWNSDTRIVATHENGTQIATDMPSELGGSGDKVTPGWLFRAGFASCAATTIAMAAARSGIALQALEVRASSRSDMRGLLGMMGDDSEHVTATPQDMQLHIKIAARGLPTQQLRTLVEEGLRCSPIPCAVQNALPVALHIEVEAA
jgi:uncharacterized OsmC-like protein